MMLWEEGAFELKDPVAQFIPAFADARVWARREPAQAGDRARGRAGAHVAPAHPHVAGSRTASTTRTRSTASTATTASSSARRQGMDLARVRATRWAALPLLFEPGTRVELQRLHRRARPGGRGRSPASRSTRSSRSASSARSGMTDTGVRAPPTRAAGRALRRPGLVRNDAARARRALRAPAFLSGGGGLVSTAADYHRFTRMLLGGGERTARACSAPVRCATWPATTCPAAPS